jgi:hypothetical protein
VCSIVSDFREVKTTIAHIWTKVIVRALYATFRLTTGLRVVRLPNDAPAMAREPYVPRREDNSLAGPLYASPWEFSPG